MIRAALALLPVLALLAALVFLDSYKLVPLRAVLRAILVGGLAALACAEANRALVEAIGIAPGTFSRYVAPVVEETGKALWVAWLVGTRRVGFLVDAGILGFAVGTGFALVENAGYLLSMPTTDPWVWIVRGLGTAVLHGAATAIFAMLARSAAGRKGAARPVDFVPGLLAAVCVHSAYNHFLLPPVAATALLLAVLPPLVILTFERSERATRKWLGLGMDTDVELLRSIRTGEIGKSRVGAYLRSLTARFPGAQVADILCLLRIHLELSIRAKGLLLAREAGLSVAVGPEVRASLEEMRYLERAIGPTGLLALSPIRRTSGRDLWQLRVLAAEAGGSAASRPSSAT